ncbi:MAG: hypothetical protein IPJ60_12115 [Sphingobacteriaceae bacterium]|nr:hypothetical protein [Sphingobacteriaceae bacterium]
MKRSLIIICICIAKILSAQSDSNAISAPLIGIHFGGDLPFADMGVRYGANLNAGFNFMYKTKKNFYSALMPIMVLVET